MLKTIILTLTLSLFLGCVAAKQRDVYMMPKQGDIMGTGMIARNGDAFDAFYGLPFAQPPVGEFRFQPPRPATGWEGTRNATESRSECLYGPPDDPNQVTGSEDCLFVNVFTKHTADREAKRPVLVWFHGGAFIFGGAQVYDPSYIMEEDVVLVVVQYRLNLFGFLSLEDEHAPGNYGMLDQVEALRWVKANILDYGGDPDSVTIFGMSAGGASVHYHMLSPLSNGLFKNAISLSGSSLNWWAHAKHPRKDALKLAKHKNCGGQDSKQILDCLRQIPAEELFDANRIFFDWHPFTPEAEPMNVFSPRSDPESSNPFLPLHPLEAMEQGKINPVPYMLGYAEKEGIWRANYVMPDDDEGKLWNQFVDKLDQVLPLALGLFGNRTGNVDALRKRLVDYYELKDLKNLDSTKINNFLDASGDSMFNYGIDKTAKLHAKHSKADTFFHFVTFPGAHTLANMGIDHSLREHPLEEMRAATHGTDMLLLFPMFPFDPMPEEDVAVSRELVKLVVDFAKNSKPTQYKEWKPFDEADPSYLVIDGPNFSTAKTAMPFQERYKFWDTLDVYWNYALGRRTTKDKGRNEL